MADWKKIGLQTLKWTAIAVVPFALGIYTGIKVSKRLATKAEMDKIKKEEEAKKKKEEEVKKEEDPKTEATPEKK